MKVWGYILCCCFSGLQYCAFYTTNKTSPLSHHLIPPCKSPTTCQYMNQMPSYHLLFTGAWKGLVLGRNFFSAPFQLGCNNYFSYKCNNCGRFPKARTASAQNYDHRNQCSSGFLCRMKRVLQHLLHSHQILKMDSWPSGAMTKMLHVFKYKHLEKCEKWYKLLVGHLFFSQPVYRHKCIL